MSVWECVSVCVCVVCACVYVSVWRVSVCHRVLFFFIQTIWRYCRCHGLLDDRVSRALYCVIRSALKAFSVPIYKWSFSRKAVNLILQGIVLLEKVLQFFVTRYTLFYCPVLVTY